MKKLSLWAIISILFISCTAESNSDLKTAELQSKPSDFPENSKNAYDVAGQLYFELNEAYLQTGNISVTTSGTILQVENIANLNVEFQTIRPALYASPTALQINPILDADQPAAMGMISTAHLSAKAKTALSAFVTTLMAYQQSEAEYETVAGFILDYEETFLDETGYTATDRKRILTTTSIARFAIYHSRKRKPKDRDWEISWGHLVAAIEGTGNNTAQAIVLAVTYDIISNN